MILSGIMMPYALPTPIRQIGALPPLRWYGIASRRVVARGGGARRGDRRSSSCS
jgi:hypothetical protein